MRYRLVVVNNPNDGVQRCTKLGPGGFVSSSLEVVHDEMVHGPLTEAQKAQVGGLSRSGDKISFSQSAKDSNDAKLAALSQKQTAKESAETYIRSADVDAVSDLDGLKAVVKRLVDIQKA